MLRLRTAFLIRAFATMPIVLATTGFTDSEMPPWSISCANDAAEITCSRGACLVEPDAFTPMRLELSEESVTLAAYSIILEGTVVSQYDGKAYRFFDLALAQVDPDVEGGEGGAPETVRVGVIYRPDYASAILSWDGYAQVMGCR